MWDICNIPFTFIFSPYGEIPLQEKWLFENEEALKRVKKGLLESSKGQLK